MKSESTNKKIKYSDGGFTMVEMMIAVFILVVGIAAILNIFPLGLQIRTGAQMAAVATWLGQEKMEEIISTPYSEISTGTIEPKDNLEPPYDSYKRETIVSCLEGVNLTEVSCDSQPTPLKKIKITVFWKPPFKATEDKIELLNLIVKK